MDDIVETSEGGGGDVDLGASPPSPTSAGFQSFEIPAVAFREIAPYFTNCKDVVAFAGTNAAFRAAAQSHPVLLYNTLRSHHPRAFPALPRGRDFSWQDLVNMCRSQAAYPFDVVEERLRDADDENSMESRVVLFDAGYNNPYVPGVRRKRTVLPSAWTQNYYGRNEGDTDAVIPTYPKDFEHALAFGRASQGVLEPYYRNLYDGRRIDDRHQDPLDPVQYQGDKFTPRIISEWEDAMAKTPEHVWFADRVSSEVESKFNAVKRHSLLGKFSTTKLDKFMMENPQNVLDVDDLQQYPEMVDNIDMVLYDGGVGAAAALLRRGESPFVVIKLFLGVDYSNRSQLMEAVVTADKEMAALGDSTSPLQFAPSANSQFAQVLHVTRQLENLSPLQLKTYNEYKSHTGASPLQCMAHTAESDPSCPSNSTINDDIWE
jgi:hypothetical protein